MIPQRSKLDNDLYKITMQQAVLMLYPKEIVRYKLINRGGTQFPLNMVQYLRSAIFNFSQVNLDYSEKAFLRGRRFLTPAYIDFFDGYKFNPSEVEVSWQKGNLQVDIVGPWYRTILWEVPLMALICEVYYKLTNQFPTQTFKQRQVMNTQKAMDLHKMGAKYSLFCTRRRYSFDYENEVTQTILESKGSQSLIGTSNLYCAKRYGLTPVGTQAHEWYMFHGARFGYKAATKMALDKWVQVYQGDLGIALTDTFTTKAFLKDFELLHSKLFDGGRQDSDDPNVWTMQMTEHYKSLRIPIASKTYLYSDALNSKKVRNIKQFNWKNDIEAIDRYGIGTWWSNDLIGIPPLNIVIKLDGILVNGEWISAVKISDTDGKNTGRKKEVSLCKRTLGINA